MNLSSAPISSRQHASLIERMNEIKDHGRLMSLERIAMQVALNLSAELLIVRRHLDSREEKIDSRIRLLADQISEQISDS